MDIDNIYFDSMEVHRIDDLLNDNPGLDHVTFNPEVNGAGMAIEVDLEPLTDLELQYCPATPVGSRSKIAALAS